MRHCSYATFLMIIQDGWWFIFPSQYPSLTGSIICSVAGVRKFMDVGGFKNVGMESAWQSV